MTACRVTNEKAAVRYRHFMTFQHVQLRKCGYLECDSSVAIPYREGLSQETCLSTLKGNSQSIIYRFGRKKCVVRLLSLIRSVLQRIFSLWFQSFYKLCLSILKVNISTSKVELSFRFQLHSPAVP